jgi:hypothetical protein
VNERRKVLRKNPQKRASVHVPPALVFGGLGTMGFEPRPYFPIPIRHGFEVALAIDHVAYRRGGGSGVGGY